MGIGPDARLKLLNILAIFKDATEGLFDGVFIQAISVEFEKRLGPIKGFGNTRFFL